MARPEEARPVVWTIAGSDSGGGAGIQADLHAINALNCHCCTVITAITAQNSFSVSHILPVPAESIHAQFAALAEDLPPRAIKLGMLGSLPVINSVCDAIGKLLARVSATPGSPRPVIVVDPVMVATAGARLLDVEATQAYRERVLPLADVLTPNLLEAEYLLSRSLKNEAEVEQGARDLLKMGPKAVVIKGGHPVPTGVSEAFAMDHLAVQRDNQAGSLDCWWLTLPRQPASAPDGKPNSHGSGCSFSSCIAAWLARGNPLTEAVVVAKAYVAYGVRLSTRLGAGPGPVLHYGNWPPRHQDLPLLRRSPGPPTVRFAPVDTPHRNAAGTPILGFYPIVPNADWIARLLPLGVRTIQLRAKNLPEDQWDLEVSKAVQICKRYPGTRLFINDRWDLAMRHQAYGVHLGQDDLPDAETLEKIARSGMRLGISTHDHGELALGLGLAPSYLALGPIFATGSKSDIGRLGSRGLDAVREWRRAIPSEMPLVTIGGINEGNVQSVLDAGCESIAVIAAVVNAPDPEAAAKSWLSFWPREP